MTDPVVRRGGLPLPPPTSSPPIRLAPYPPVISGGVAKKERSGVFV
nr:MAG TPA: hypothetical protein [Caudoviricetes sp.]